MPDCTTDFSCQRCGNCCRGPGDVILTTGEVEAIAHFLNMTIYAFTEAYTRLLSDRQGLSLIERADGACIFLQPEQNCRIQAVKPNQCAGFPFVWRSERLASQCPALQRCHSAAREVETY